MPQQFRRFALCLTVSLLLAQHLYAQELPDAGKSLKELHEPSRPAKPAPKIEVTPPSQPGVKKDSSVRLKVTAFRIAGNTVYSEQELLARLEFSPGQEVTLAGLQQAAGIITAYYRGNGYLLARAYLPVQELDSGIVVIEVLEGRVGRVIMQYGEGLRLSESATEKFMAGLHPGDPINEAALERILLILNDVPGVTVKATLAPGQKMGESDIIVRVEKDARLVSGSVQADNWGNRFLGQYRLSPTVMLNNPSGFGDQVALQGAVSETGGLLFGRLSYVVPVGHRGTRAGVGYTYLTYALGEDFESLDAHGTAQVASLFALHPFVRRRQFDLYGQSSIEYKRLEDRVDAVSIVAKKDALVWTVTLSGDARDGWAGGGLNTFSLAYLLGRLDVPPPDLPDTDGLYRKVNYQLARAQRVFDELLLYLSMSGQYATKNLDSSEKLILGGPQGVRAYPVGELAMDLGNLATAELRWSLPPWRLPGRIVGSVFFDDGWGQINKEMFSGVTKATNHRNLISYGGGITWGIPQNTSLGATIAWHGHEDPTSDVDRRPRVWVFGEKRF